MVKEPTGNYCPSLRRVCSSEDRRVTDGRLEIHYHFGKDYYQNYLQGKQVMKHIHSLSENIIN